MQVTEELSIVLRYVLGSEIKEVFVDFVEVARITGEVLARTILQWLQEHGLSLTDMRGQCYDGASKMSGARSGCKSIVQQEAPLAMYYHCAAHRLNLTVVSACNIQAFKNAESYAGEIARFFSFSAKRQRLLDVAIDSCDSTSKAKKLKDACRTRWVQRIDSYAVFLELLPALHTCFEAMVHPVSHAELGTNWSWDGETITKANGFLFQLQSSTFLVAFQVLIQVLHILRELTMKLQMQAIDVVYAYKMVSSVVSTLKALRRDSPAEFKKIFTEATKLGQQLHGEKFVLSKPRLAGRQTHRSNPPSSTAEDYYRITLYDEFLSHVIAELEDRFLNNPSHKIALGLLYLLPNECASLEDCDHDSIPLELAEAVDLYRDDMTHAVMFPTEYGLWVCKWKAHQSESTRPNKLIDVFQVCSDFQYPNIHSLLRVALTLPITSCESERSFSQLKLIKIARRTTMTESRLAGLSLMKINRDRCNTLTSETKMRELVKSFSQLHPRRMKLPFMLSD